MPLYFLYAYLPESVAHGIVAAYIAVVGVLLGWAFAGKGVHPTFKTVQHLFGAALVFWARWRWCCCGPSHPPALRAIFP
jgi:hypothetical protein